MISTTDIEALRASFDGSVGPGLPTSLCTDCARLLGVSDVTISFLGASDQFTLGASSAEARSLDEWEFTLREGPGVDTATTNASSMSETEDSEMTLWPRLSAKAQAIGYRSLAGTPLQVGGRVFGTISLQDRNGMITTDTLAEAEQIAREIATLIVARLSQHTTSIDDQADHYKVHQATGMVMAQMGIGAEAAIDMLRAHAWTQDRLLIDVADDVVSRLLKFGETERPSE